MYGVPEAQYAWFSRHAEFPLATRGVAPTVSGAAVPTARRTRSTVTIDRFQAEKSELVVNDDGVVGLLTATDAFAAVPGDLEDPVDPEA